MPPKNSSPDALRIITAVRDRHDGLKCNPYDEQECGHHYVRSMAAWSLPVAEKLPPPRNSPKAKAWQ